ncbi:hypothetical protein HYPGJ_31658 [Hyphomicrobium sp. GJ21]|nr:hypothetical protein HYPGJ_31658 [Hyphomicrobium sp. GJ21]
MTTLVSARWMLICRSDEDDRIKKYIEYDRAGTALTVAAMRLRIGAQFVGSTPPRGHDLFGESVDCQCGHSPGASRGRKAAPGMVERLRYSGATLLECDGWGTDISDIDPNSTV